MLSFADIDRLLDPEPLDIELGIERGEDGVLHVAVRTDMPGCTGAMFEWWSNWVTTTQHYIWWHPRDHFEFGWRDKRPDTYVGATQVVRENLSGPEIRDLLVAFQPPESIFTSQALLVAEQSGAASVVIAGRTAQGPDAPLDADGAILGGRIAHVGRDTPAGCVMRSHIWLGVDWQLRGDPYSVVAADTPDHAGRQVTRHVNGEFQWLSRFLPSLYFAENRDQEMDRLPLFW